MATDTEKRLANAVADIKAAGARDVEIGMILGSGLGDLVDRLEIDVDLPVAAITGMAASTAPGHQGRLVFGRWRGRRVAAFQGRLHLYEGWSAADIALPVYVLKRLGARVLVVTNAAGGLNPAFEPGDVMVVDDHINLTGASALTGPNSGSLGPRWVDMTDAYDRPWRDAALDAANHAGIALRRGIYVGIRGPEFETSAERRAMRAMGGDAVGASTIHEVIAAKHASLKVIGFSAITNKATGGPDQQADDIDTILLHAQACGAKIATILEAMLATMRIDSM